MKKILFAAILALSAIIMNAETKTYHAYAPNYMYSLGTMTLSYNSSYMDVYFQVSSMHCDILKKMTTYDGTIYLLYNQNEGSYWVLAMTLTDGGLFKSNSTFSVRDMNAYLSTTKM